MRYLQPKMANASSISARHRAENDAYSGSRPQSQVMAVDIDEQRLSRVYDNLKRLGMKAEVKQGDGRFPEQWCGNEQFDRILLDAPAPQPALFAAIRISNGCAGIGISPS